MLADAGAGAIIVGHSERRADHGESDVVVKQKAGSGVAGRLTAIVCIGETQTQRDAGQTLDVCGTQLAGSLPEGSTARQSGGGLRAGVGDRDRADADAQGCRAGAPVHPRDAHQAIRRGRRQDADSCMADR
jgi:hypothetical protein